MSHRTIVAVLVVAMVVGLVASCAPAAEPTPTPKAAEPTKAPPTKAPEPGKTYKVALVIALLGDRSFLDSAARGIQWANEQLPNVETKIIENADVGEQQLAARAMAEEGYDLIITVGFGSADWTSQIANEYPDTHFALVDATLDVPNGTGLIFREHDGSFTVGMAAAMLTKTGKVGYVGGMDVPLLRRFQEGYIQGVKYVDPNIEVVSGWVGGWSDPTKGKELALTQYEEGADIIYAAAGKSGEGVLAASAEKGLYSIGVDSDQCYIAPGNVVASMMKMVDVSVFDAIKSLTEGTLEAGNRVYGLEQDAVGLCYLYDIDTEFVDNGPADMAAKMLEEVIPAVQAAVDKIKAGEMCIKDHMEVYPCDNPAQPGGMTGAVVEPGKTYKVALVIGLLGDRSFLDSAARGIQWVNERLPNVETRIIENADIGEEQLAARAMAEEGFDLVITVGFASVDWTTDIANEYPDTHFAIVQGIGLDVPNGTGLLFHDHEGCFTVGMAAAMLNTTGKVGFIGGMDVPTLRRFEEGYIQGVKYANPDVDVVTGWVGGWSDPTKGKELALTQFQEGVDIIFVAAGKSGEGVLAAAAEEGKYAIGVDSDQCYIEPGHVICSMLKRVDQSVYDAVKSLTEGTLEAGERYYELSNEGTGMCYLYDEDTHFLDNGPPDMVAKFQNEVIPAVKVAAQKIASGEMCVLDHMELKPCDNPALPGGMSGQAKVFKVALVIGLLGDRGYNDSIALGIRMADEQLPNVETKIVENADLGEQQLAARAMAEEGYDLIFTVGFASVDWTTEVAKEYPDTHFVLLDGDLDLPNGTGITFMEHHGSFGVGMIAAMLSETGKVGFISGMDVPTLRRWELGYIEGVKYVNPDIEVVSGWVGSWGDPTKGKELALTQYQEGVDIIFACAGGSSEGVFQASVEQDLFSIGAGLDHCETWPGHVIASMLKRAELAVLECIKDHTMGKLEAGNRAYGVGENAVGACYLFDIDTAFVDNGPPDMVAKFQDTVLPAVRAANAQIKAGAMCVSDYMEIYPCDNPPQPGGFGG